MSEVRTSAFWSAVLTGTCIGISLLAHPGIPAYRHDWQWPVDAATFAAWFWSKLGAWNWQGSGQPNIAIQVHPFFALNTLAAHVVSSKLILTGWLTLEAAVAAAGGAVYVMTRFGVRPFPAIVTGVLYGLSPLVVNKMVAGHIQYLLGYAAVPWLVVATSSRHRCAPWAVGLSLAWITLQIQILVFGAALALTTAFGLFKFRRSLLLPLALAAGCMLPYAWALLHAGAGQVTTEMHTSIPWEVVLSAPLSEAMRGVGYFAGYWEKASASGWGSPLVPWLYLAGIALALLVRRDTGVYRLALIYVLGVLLVSGLKGPIAGPLSWLFGHVPAASAFRELYDAAVLLSFAGAAGAGIALNAIPSGMVQAAATSVIVIATVTPWLGGGVFGQTGSAFFTPSVRSAVAEIAKAARPSRFYVSPGANPVGPSSSKTGGADPATFPVNHVAPYWIYLVRGQEGAVIWALQRGGGEAAAAAKSLGISAILTQPNLTSKFAAGLASGKDLHIQEFSGALPGIPGWSAAQGPNGVLVPADGQPSVLRLIREKLEAADTSRLQDEGLVPGIHGLPIDMGWVPAQDWWFLSDSVAQAAPHGIVTASHNVPLLTRCTNGRSAMDLYATGRGRVGAAIISPRKWHKLIISCGDRIRASAAAKAYLVVTSGNDLAAWRSFVALGRLPDGPLDVRESGGELVATATGDCHGCTLVLSERASPGWLMSVGSKSRPPTSMPGGFSAWRVDLSKGQTIRVYYAPARYAAILEWCATACWAWLLGGLAWSLIRRPTLSDSRAVKTSGGQTS